MNSNEAMELAKSEFARYKDVFAETEAQNPGLSYVKLIELMDYEHPLFDNVEDEDLYYNAVDVVALSEIVAALSGK